MNKPFILLITLFLASLAQADDVLEFRLAKSVETPGWTKAELQGSPLWLKPSADLTSEHIASARYSPSKGTERRPQVLIKFTDGGKELFAKVTGENTGEKLAILSGNKIISSAMITGPITGGEAVLTGNFTEELAKEFARKINARAHAKHSAPPPQK